METINKMKIKRLYRDAIQYNSEFESACEKGSTANIVLSAVKCIQSYDEIFNVIRCNDVDLAKYLRI